MNSERHARQAARLLSHAGHPTITPAVPVTEDERADTIRIIERALESRRRSRSRRRGLALLSVAAALVIAAVTLGPSAVRLARRPEASASSPTQVLAVRGTPGATLSVSRAGETTVRPVAGGLTLMPGDRLLAHGGGRAALVFATGTLLTLDGTGTSLIVVDAGAAARFALRRGRVHADVAPLAAGQRFVIETRDAQVEVRGTSFEVALAPEPNFCAGGSPTQVSVEHGRVEVTSAATRSTTLLGAGQSWPSPCHVSRPEPRTSRPLPAPTGARASSPAPTRSTLAAQNDLYARAMEAKHGGHPRHAAVLLDRLVATWPESPLVESALVEKTRILRALEVGTPAAPSQSQDPE